MLKILAVIFIVLIFFIAGCQNQNTQEKSDSVIQEETSENTPESIAKDLETTDEFEDPEDFEVLIDEDTF